jgi:cytochrome c oxidase cbb3-type subunit 4
VEINTLRAIVTTMGLIVFIGIIVWAWRRRNTADFKEAANLPFKED